MRLLLPTLLLATALAAPPLRAQSTGALAEYWQALQATSSPAAVRPPAGPSERVVAEGLYQLRRWELERDRTAALVGRQSLERLVAREPGNAWAHFALGTLLARGPDVRETVGGATGGYVVWRHSLAAQRAPRALRRALELDSTLHEAAGVLGRLALDLGDARLLVEAERELTRSGRGVLPGPLALRAEIRQALGDARGSIVLADSAARLGLDPSVAAHLAAAAGLQLPGEEGEAADRYFEGVAGLSDAGAAAYFDAVGALAPDARVAEWRATDLPGKRAWLRRLWTLEAALAGVSVPERLAEHYRRLAEVRAEGRVAPMGDAAAEGPFDARRYGVPSLGALLLLRHGDERRAERLQYCGSEVLDLPLALQPTPEECARTPLGRHRASSPYPRLERLRSQERAATGSSYYPPFRTHLALAWEVLQFRGGGGSTEVVAALAVPASSATALLHEGVLRARATLLLIDTAAGDVVRGESRPQFAVPALPPGGHVLLSASALTREPGRRLFRIALSDTTLSAGRIVGGSVEVRDLGTGALALSDLVLAPLDGAPSFARGAQRLSMAPGREFRRDESAALYFEIYGLPAGAAYRTDITVQPEPEGILAHIRALFPGAPDALRLSFSEEAGSAHQVHGVQQLRTVGLAGLVPGRYRLRVAVTAADGSVAQAERELWMVSGEER